MAFARIFRWWTAIFDSGRHDDDQLPVVGRGALPGRTSTIASAGNSCLRAIDRPAAAVLIHVQAGFLGRDAGQRARALKLHDLAIPYGIASNEGHLRLT